MYQSLVPLRFLVLCPALLQLKLWLQNHAVIEWLRIRNCYNDPPSKSSINNQFPSQHALFNNIWTEACIWGVIIDLKLLCDAEVVKVLLFCFSRLQQLTEVRSLLSFADLTIAHIIFQYLWSVNFLNTVLWLQNLHLSLKTAISFQTPQLWNTFHWDLRESNSVLF